MGERDLIPQPPFDTAIDPTLQTVVTAVMAVFAALALLYALYSWARTRKPTFLLLWLGGGAMMTFEPLVDTVGLCWFPEGNSWIAIRAYGRTLPVWLCLCYFFYFGIGVGASWQLMRRGLTRQGLWLLYGAAVVADTVLEIVLMHFDTYYYYGAQPLVFLKFPLWWAAVNALIPMVAGAVVYRFEAVLTRGAQQLLIIPVLLTCSAGINAMAGWPAWFVINSDVGAVGTQAGGVLTCLLAVWLMKLVVDAAALNTGTQPSRHMSPAFP